MSLFIVDVESDGPCPGLYSMISFGAIKVDKDLQTTFYGTTRPITDNFEQERLDLLKLSRKEHESYEDPAVVMVEFAKWVIANSEGSPKFMSDNLAFDWQFINYYLILFNNKDNPFGWSGRRIGDLYSGLRKNMRASSEWKRLRKTKHTHHPVDDARGNAEAVLAFSQKFELVLPK